MKADGTTMLMNESMLQALGYSLTEVVGKNYPATFVPEEDRAELASVFKILTELNEPTFSQNRVVTKDGRHLLVEWHGRSILNVQGDFEFFFGVGIDITERRKAEKALKESEEKYRAIFEGSLEGIYQVSPEGLFLSANPALAAMLGYASPKELMDTVTDPGRQLYMDPKARDEGLRLLTEQGVCDGFETRCRRKDGSTVWVLLSAHLVYDENGAILCHEGTCRDITERKRMEQELKFKNTLLSVQQEASIDGILVVDENGIILSFNTRFAEMFQIPREVMETRSDERALNAALDGISEPEQFLRKVHYLYENKRETSRDEVALRDGRTFDRYSSPMFGSDGSYYGRVWYFRDITRRKEAEEALRRSEARYRSLLESIRDAVYIIDSHGHFAFVNDVMVKRSGHPREWFMGRHYLDVLRPEYWEQARNAFDANMGGEEVPPYEVMPVYKGPSGEDLWAEVNRTPIYEDGRVVGILGVSRDITDRKRAEEALRHSENRYKTLLESIQDGVCIVGRDRRFTFVNDVIVRRSGYSPEWFYGRTHRDLVKADAREAIQARVEACFKGEKVPPYEVSYVNASRDEVWVESHISPLYEGKEIVGLMGINRDITERKHLEEELRRHRGRLEQLVAERTAALTESEKRYRELVDNALVGVYQSTLGGEILYHNDFFIRMVGFESLDEIRASDSPLRYRNLADREPLLRTLGESGRVTKYETEFFTRDCEILNVLVSASLNGNVISGMVLDITDRKKVEEALKTSEQNLRLVFNSTHDGIVIHDARGQILEVNDRMLEMYGVPREDALGLSIIDDYSAPDQPLDQLPRVWESVVEGTDHLFEWKNRRRDGSAFDVEVFNTKIRLGGRDLILAMIRDITERKRAEYLLQESEKNYRDLVDNALVGVYKTRLNGEILYVNRTLLRMAGFESMEEMGSAASFYMRPGDRGALIGLLRGTGAVHNHELELRTRKGKPISVLLSATLEGNVMSGMIMDITDRKVAETELEEKSIRLQDTNTALRVLLDQREEDKREMEGRFRANLKSLVVPYIEGLLSSPLAPRQKSMVQSMEANVHIILSPLMKDSRDHYAHFTPTEVVVADLIKEGRSTKEIAVRLSVTESAVNLHRLNIRNKLGLKNVKRNLRSYLLSFSS